MARVFIKPRAWKTNPALSNSMGSPTSEGWAKFARRDMMKIGSRNPWARATRLTIYFQGNHLKNIRLLAYEAGAGHQPPYHEDIIWTGAPSKERGISEFSPRH